jgi:hypothetical protein
MAKVVLRVSYRVPVHHIADFEKTLVDQVIPLAEELGITSKGTWKALVGNVGEFLELWEFDSMADFESKWKNLLGHPDLQKIFQSTGTIVRDESFALFEPVCVSD